MSLLQTFLRSRHSFQSQVTKRTARLRDYDAHSPMFRNRHFDEKKRSRLFSDRPMIFGRFPKFVIAWAFSMQMWSAYYLYHKHALAMHLQEESRKAYRRTVPFVQAMEDVRFCAVQERNYMILKAVCDYVEPGSFDVLRSRYHQEDFFLSYYRGTTMRNHYDGRYGGSRFWNMKSDRRPEDERGLVGLQETSIYG